MKSAEGLVSITIVNWNSSGYIEKCLDSIKKQLYPAIELIVVDNSSTDSSLEYIAKNFPQVKIVKNKENLGFSKSHNLGIHLAKGEFILPLNFDVFLEPDFVGEMVKMMKNDSSIGIVSGKLYRQTNGNKTKILDSTGITMRHCFMHPRGQSEEDRGQYDNSEGALVFGACGAAPLYRKAMLEDIRSGREFFDEDFVNYVEDVDLSWRACLRNWKCVYNPSAVAYHERGATRKDNTPMKKDYLIFGLRNRYCCIIKNLPARYLKKNFGKIFLKETSFLLMPIKEIPRGLRFKSFLLTAPMLRAMLKKRALIQRNKLIKENELELFLDYKSLKWDLLSRKK
ncbi:MAG: glycosyltransferase family 2 protein [Candidatus Omnitrophica bacterium]|nr:glycosyltransferase family 2 protein [Candidatus Omnitrophota bacterium]